MSSSTRRIPRFPEIPKVNSCMLSSDVADRQGSIPIFSTGKERDRTFTPKISRLNEHQLGELLRGRYPSDYRFEVIHLSDAAPETSLIYDALRDHKRVVSERTFSMTTVRNAPTPLHQWVVSGVTNLLTSQMPAGTRVLYGSPIQDLTSLKEDKLIPDLQLLYPEHGALEPKAVLSVEIGFSQQYESLQHAVRRAIDATQNVNVSLMINLKEKYTKFDKKPAFRAPFSPTSSGLYQHPITKEKPVVLGTRWVGRVEGTLEVWVRDKVTQKAVRKLGPILFYGSKLRVDKDTPYIDARNEDVQLGLNLSDIIISANDNLKKPFVVDWVDLRECINQGRIALAESRCLTTMRHIAELNGKKK
ncbi:hypothetical protein TESG_02318 [Trichophyton tonsurans CBS 112818]|uniref:Uncharacterized protein n=1 Tax=Trichophyton tonsurans (strain CBS 112818) TaxID=647933 RepID=F2RU16_TRIT1|nr:hypothetical protein TESG_02318 [Trichophyton tonsurans CBS 112818]